MTEHDARLRAARAALSELFLDTELDAGGLARLARSLEETGLPLGELDRIFVDELEPVLAGNLNVPAGEWSGFDIDWLEAQIDERAQRGSVRSALDRALRSVRGASAARADWDKLKATLATTGA